MRSLRLILPAVAVRVAVCVVAVAVAAGPVPALCVEATWSIARPEDAGLNGKELKKARDYALTGGGSGYIIRGGKLVLSWGDPKKRYDLKSTTKSFGATALGVAILDGRLALADKVRQHHPGFGTPPDSNLETGWINDVTILHLATQTAGFEKPGGYTKLMFEPGTRWAYSDGGPNWLAECVTLAYKQDVDQLMFERVFTPLGISRNDLVWRNNSYRARQINGIARREFGSGISANVDAMARIGLLYLREGLWNGTRILPEKFVKQVSTTVPSVVGLPEVDPQNYGNASDHYGLLWWNNADGTLKDVPRDTYWSWGLYDSLIVVIPSLDMVVSRAGKSWKRNWSGHYDVLQPFLGPIVAAVKLQKGGSNASRPDRHGMIRPVNSHEQDVLPECDFCSDDTLKSHATAAVGPPYPPSRVITQIDWASPSTIVRRARGGDNWPMTWADDNQQYTAYGDGRGFEPFVERKLSMGLCRVVGEPHDFQGFNLRSPTAERKGGGASGPKASGLLMVDGVLFMLVRNTGNSQLAWSKDRGRTWKWSDWKFTESFGYPTFLNFGRNYEGARDEYVYIYSHDCDSAYQPGDQMVMVRVPKTSVTQRNTYEFFAGLDHAGKPTWSREIARRAAVLKHEGRCYRSGISYNAAIRRYLWCQILPGDDTRFEGGFAIFDAPEPWGPWTTAFFTEKWDVGPGETSSIPTKWISADGRTVHLVFSGDDHFSVRQAKLSVKQIQQPARR